MNYGSDVYNNKISKEKINISYNINILLNNFNSTLYQGLKKILKNYDYYSINHTAINKVFNNYSSLIKDILDKSIQKIKNLKSNNIFYSVPKIYLNKIYSKRRNKIKELISNFSNEFDFNIFGYKYNLAN